jgi:hypothetical protein
MGGWLAVVRPLSASVALVSSHRRHRRHCPAADRGGTPATRAPPARRLRVALRRRGRLPGPGRRRLRGVGPHRHPHVLRQLSHRERRTARVGLLPQRQPPHRGAWEGLGWGWGENGSVLVRRGGVARRWATRAPRAPTPRRKAAARRTRPSRICSWTATRCVRAWVGQGPLRSRHCAPAARCGAGGCGRLQDLQDHGRQRGAAGE